MTQNNKKSCNMCKETSCILQGNINLKNKKLFVDLRMDMEENQLDIEVVDGCLSEWTHAVDINYCPFCGRKLFQNLE